VTKNNELTIEVNRDLRKVLILRPSGIWRHVVFYNQRFGDTFCLHLQGKNEPRGKSGDIRKGDIMYNFSSSAQCSTLRMGAECSSERFLSTRLHGVALQKTVIFRFTAARTSNLTSLCLKIVFLKRSLRQDPDERETDR
jgi:hypothetical protein